MTERSVVYASDFGAGPTKTPAENLQAVREAIAALGAEGGTVKLPCTLVLADGETIDGSARGSLAARPWKP